MRILRTAAELNWTADKVGFVPTMGAFHEGHLALMRKAKKETGFCVVSLFVNPTQFGKNEDFDKYPRNEDRDFSMAESAGVDAIFAPSTAEVYRDSSTVVQVRGVADLWEGALRPGHFDGVATVVAKLFGLVRPTDAYFGLKDYQQCQVIRAMVRDLFIPVQLHLEETVREPTGLAMSSRNVYLSEDARARASLLSKTLQLARDQIATGEPISTALQIGSKMLAEAGMEVQYFAAVNPAMQPIEQVTSPSRLIAAVRLDGVRLIDNVALA